MDKKTKKIHLLGHLVTTPNLFYAKSTSYFATQCGVPARDVAISSNPELVTCKKCLARAASENS